MSRENKGRLILVAGCVAAGKSTFARRLGGRLQIPCFCKDRVKEELAEGMGDEAYRVRNKSLSLAAGALLAHIAGQVLKAQGAVILESNFRPGELRQLERLPEQWGGSILTYRFTGVPAVLYERFCHRENTPGRHPIHKANSPVSLTAFEEVLQELTDFSIRGEVVEVDATDFDNVDWNSLVDRGARFLHTGR